MICTLPINKKRKKEQKKEMGNKEGVGYVSAQLFCGVDFMRDIVMYRETEKTEKNFENQEKRVFMLVISLM